MHPVFGKTPPLSTNEVTSYAMLFSVYATEQDGIWDTLIASHFNSSVNRTHSQGPFYL